TASTFLFLGLCTAFATSSKRKIRRLSIIAGAIMFALSYFGLVGYLYGVPQLYKIQAFTSMAVLTALCFMLLSIAALSCLVTDRPISLFNDRTSAGFVFRRLIPFALILPPLAGFLRKTN